MDELIRAYNTWDVACIRQYYMGPSDVVALVLLPLLCSAGFYSLLQVFGVY